MALSIERDVVRSDRTVADDVIGQDVRRARDIQIALRRIADVMVERESPAAERSQIARQIPWAVDDEIPQGRKNEPLRVELIRIMKSQRALGLACRKYRHVRKVQIRTRDDDVSASAIRARKTIRGYIPRDGIRDIDSSRRTALDAA